MAQTNFTPISLYYSTTAAAVPTAGNLVAGELAINTTDGRLYYKDTAGVVQILAGKGGSGVAGGSNTQVQYNSSGSLTGSANFTFNGTTVTMANDASISGLTVGKGLGSTTSNTAVGLAALATNTSGTANSGFGVQALQLNTTGSGNAAFGGGDLVNYNATLKQNTTGSNNSAFGLGAMGSNTTGGNNTGLGFQALSSNTTASDNTAVGFQSLFSNTTGTFNTAIGGRVTGFSNAPLYSNTTGSSNSALGGGALSSNTTGNNNAAFGMDALRGNTTATNNTAVGYQAGYSATTSLENTLVGYQAGYSISTGNGRNTAVGIQSLRTTTTGTDNVAIGYYAGYLNTTGNGNVFVGGGLFGFNLPAGYNSTGSTNTYVGGSAGALMTTGSKNTILGVYNGNQDGLDIRTASNRVVLSDGDGNVKLYVDDLDSQYQLTTAGRSQFRTYLNSNGVYANGATVDFASMSGLIIVNNWAVGSVALFMVGGGNVTTISSIGGAFGSVTFTAGVYRWTNTSGFSYTYSFTAIATRPDA
jgi:hypothetical protein